MSFLFYYYCNFSNSIWLKGDDLEVGRVIDLKNKHLKMAYKLDGHMVIKLMISENNEISFNPHQKEWTLLKRMENWVKLDEDPIDEPVRLFYSLFIH